MQSARTKAAFQEMEQGKARANGHTPLVAAGAASGAKPAAAGARQSPRTMATPAPQHGTAAAAPAGAFLRHSAAAQGRDIGADMRNAWEEPASQRMRAAATAPRGAQYAGQPAPPQKQPDSASHTDTKPDYASRKGAAGSVPAADSSPDYSATPKAKAAGAAPLAPWTHLPDGVPAGDGSPDYSARTGQGAAGSRHNLAQGVRGRPGSAAAAACGACAGTATAVTALAQDMCGLQAFSRQMLQEVMGEMRGLQDRSASLEGHVRQLSAEVTRLAELFQGAGAPNGERSQASRLTFRALLARSACLSIGHDHF